MVNPQIELSKRKNTNLDELRNNVVDIWARFPQELCEKIIGEFDDKNTSKIKGKILNKTLVKNFKKKDEIKVKTEYDWDSFKRERCIRIVYNDKIIGLIKKKIICKIKNIEKDKMRKYKNEHPIRKTKIGYKGAKYKDYKKKKKIRFKRHIY